MAKISNKDIYQDIDSISLLDYLIGTKKNGKGTKSFPLESVIQLINGTNGVNNIQFKFSDGTDPEVNYTTTGAFFTNTNSGEPNNFTQLVFNKDTIYPVDLTLLFEKLGATQNVVFTLKNPENPNNFVKLKVLSFTDNTTHFAFDVETYEDLVIGGFVNENIYGLYFEIIKSSEADRFLTTGTITIAGNQITISTGYSWVINGSNYANPFLFRSTIPPASASNERIDLFVVDRFNNIIKIQGVESIGNPVKPNKPLNTLELTFLTVDDNIVYNPAPPIVGNIYTEKEEKRQITLTGSGALNLPISGKFARYLISGSITQINGVSSISSINYYDGKKYTFKNGQATNVVLSHDSGTVPFKFPNNLNFILKPNEIIEFVLKTVNGFSLDYVGTIFYDLPKDQLLSKAEITITVNDVDIVGATRYVINEASYEILTPETFTINYTAAGLFRTDIIVVDTNGDYLLINGIEGAVAIKPDVPIGTLEFAEFDVTDSSITELVDVNNFWVTKLDKKDHNTENFITKGSIEETKIGTLITYGNKITDGSLLYSELLEPIRNNLSSFYNQIFYRSDYGYYNFKPLNNLAPRLYLMPNGVVTGTTCKFEMFNNDYSNDYTNYNGFNIFTNNVDNRINIGPNRGVLGGARMAMRIHGDYKGSVAANDCNSIDFFTNNDLILNRFTGAIGFGTTNTDPFGIGLANQFTFKDPSTQLTRLNIVGNSAAAGIYFGRNNIRTASVATQAATSDLDISTNPTNAGISLTSNVRIFASTGNVRIGGTAADNNVDKLQVNGTISATPATTSEQVVVKSQMDLVRPYKVYTAIVSQTGTNAPTIVVLENTLGVSVIATRTGVGQYFLNFSQSVVSPKGYFSFLQESQSVAGQTTLLRLGISGASNGISLSSSSFNSSLMLFELSDDIFDQTRIEFRSYN